MNEAIRFLRTADGHHWFDYRCIGCNAAGEMAVPVDSGAFLCPEGCGARYELYNSGDKPALLCDGSQWQMYDPRSHRRRRQ